MTLKYLKKLLDQHDETPTLDKINNYITDQHNSRSSKKRSPSHAPSSLGAKCLRKIYYNYWKIRDKMPVNAKSARIFDTGNYMEDMIVGWCKAIGEHIPYRDPLTGDLTDDPQFPITYEEYRVRRGFIDNVGVSKGELWLYEFKSSKAEKLKGLTNPMPEHLIQAGIYLKAFNSALTQGEYKHIKELDGFKEAVGVKYIYINKNTSELIEFQVKEPSFNAILSRLENKLEETNKFIDNKELPPKTKDYCFFCSYRVKCKNECNDLEK